MIFPFPLTPRYCLDDTHWLQGVDPVRRYWIAVNGDSSCIAVILGLEMISNESLEQVLQQIRKLKAGERIQLDYVSRSLSIFCIGHNCYAIQSTFRGAPVWHLFDRETLESLVETSHPDWQCPPQGLEFGRTLLETAWHSELAA